MICYFNAEDKLINIGEWDLNIFTDDRGVEVVRNPLPDGAYSKSMDVVVNDDGSRSTL